MRQRSPGSPGTSRASLSLSRFETAIVAVVVLGLTASALLTPAPHRGDVSFVLCVPERGIHHVEAGRFGGLARWLEERVERGVEIMHCADTWPPRCRLAVMSVHEYRRVGDGAGLRAVASVSRPGAAVIVTGTGADVDLAALAPEDVLFTAPKSINGCWVQLRALADAGFAPGGGLRGLRFAPAPGNPERVVYEVASGNAVAGAVPGGVLEAMIADGRILRGEVKVSLSAPALSETVLCCREDQVAGAASLVGGAPNLRPLTESEISRLDALFAWVETLGPAGNP